MLVIWTENATGRHVVGWFLSFIQAIIISESIDTSEPAISISTMSGGHQWRRTDYEHRNIEDLYAWPKTIVSKSAENIRCQSFPLPRTMVKQQKQEFLPKIIPLEHGSICNMPEYKLLNWRRGFNIMICRIQGVMFLSVKLVFHPFLHCPKSSYYNSERPISDRGEYQCR